MTLLQTILEVFHRSLIRIGRNMEITFAADNTAVKQNVAGLNIPLSF